LSLISENDMVTPSERARQGRLAQQGFGATLRSLNTAAKRLEPSAW